VYTFPLEDGTSRTAERVAAGLEKRAVALESVAAQQGILDTRPALRKSRARMDALAVHVIFWWLWAEVILVGWSVDPATKEWLAGKLRPVVYWHHQMQCCDGHP